MTEPITREQVQAGIRQEIAEQGEAAQRETDSAERERMLRHARSREDFVEEEADAIMADVAENEQAALSLRVPASLAAALKARAAAEQIPTSALVRRILTQAVQRSDSSVLSAEQVEQIVRRVNRESV
jgi:predicted DNA binding CopG/RHH family protein